MHIGRFMQVFFDSFSAGIEPQYGSQVSVVVKGVSHPGIYVGNGEVIDNSRKRGGVYRRSLEEFCDGCVLSYDGFKGDVPPEQVVKKAYAAIGTNYDFLLYNCKDFVRDMRGQAMLSLIIKGVVVTGVACAGYQLLHRS